jgi:hypothetical protein
VPIYTVKNTEEEINGIITKLSEVLNALKIDQGVRTKCDDRKNYNPGWKCVFTSLHLQLISHARLAHLNYYCPQSFFWHKHD